MTSHSEEPWSLPEHGKLEIVRPDGKGVALLAVQNGDYEQGIANAKRIVACVNFCAGFTNEQLENLKCLRDLMDSAEVLAAFTINQVDDILDHFDGDPDSCLMDDEEEAFQIAHAIEGTEPEYPDGYEEARNRGSDE